MAACVSGCDVCTGCRALHGTQYTHHNLKHMLSQHCVTYNNILYWLFLQKFNFSQAQCKFPEDGPSGLKHVGPNIRHFNVNFNILYVQWKVHLFVEKKGILTLSRCTVQRKKLLMCHNSAFANCHIFLLLTVDLYRRFFAASPYYQSTSHS